MTTPTPAPSSGTGPGGITLVAPPTSGSSSSGADRYGLGVWGGQTINPGDLPFLTAIIGSNKPTTGDDIMRAFLGAPSGQVATVQHALFMAGYYPKTFTPKWGVISPEDRNAFGSLLTISGQAGAPVTSVLGQAAAYGAEAGLAAAQAQTQSAKTAVVTLPNATDLEALALKAFQSVTGKKANPKQAARFAAEYRAMVGANEKAQNAAAYQAQTGIVAPQGNPAELVQQATGVTSQPPYTYTGGSAGAAEYGQQTTTPPSFTSQISGLQQLGQQIQPAAPQSGLTQITQEAPVSADVAAENFARNTNPQGAAANDLASTFQLFLGLLNGIGG